MTIVIAARVVDEVHAGLRRMAEDRGRTVSKMVAEILGAAVHGVVVDTPKSLAVKVTRAARQVAKRKVEELAEPAATAIGVSNHTECPRCGDPLVGWGATMVRCLKCEQNWPR